MKFGQIISLLLLSERINEERMVREKVHTQRNQRITIVKNGFARQ